MVSARPFNINVYLNAYHNQSVMIVYIVVVLCFLTAYVYQNLRRKRRTPEGLKEIPIEKGLPIIGIVYQIEKPLCKYFTKLSRKLGPIYRVKFGMRDVVVLNNFAYIKATLVNNGDALSGRWKSLKYTFVTNGYGVTFTEGKVWTEQRSFILKTLKKFGMGGSKSMNIVQEECVSMLDVLNDMEGKSFNFAKFIPIYTLNVISKIVMNRAFKHGDPDFATIDKYMSVTSKANDPVSHFLLMFPFFENYEWLMEFVIWITSRKAIIDSSHDLFRKEIKNHLNYIDLESDGDDLMDRFLIKQHQMKKNNGDVESFTEWQLVRNTLDLIAAGYDTTSALITWSFVIIGMYPEIQNKVHEEIIDKIGNEKLPTMSDKACLDYTQAVMDEVMRVSSIAPFALFHRTLSDISVNGYFIPKDTVVIPNIYACHFDPNVWERPLDFYPEHFLHLAECGVYKYKSREELILFSMGKRQCLAESLARMEYFIFFTSILQRFQVSLLNKKSYSDVFCVNEGLIRTPVIRDLIFKRREKIF